ncbi:MAG: right-handed parallel beta-helix repeat-containing protein [Verrucomicrobiae bacterium]|nr:right-handed parallel beta-helix repeat-containing protein [Verrucomicrobiae bacterium]
MKTYHVKKLKLSPLLHGLSWAALTLYALICGPNTAQAATIVVNSTADPAGYNQQITIAQLGATVTLRDAFNAAINEGGQNTITFAPGLAGQTIYLSQTATGDADTALDMSYPGFENQYDLTIQGLTGNSGVTLASSGSTQLRLFLCESDVNLNSLTLNDLTISGWQDTNGWGGAIQNVSGVLTLNRCTLVNNRAIFGGALYNNTLAQTTLNNCTLANNTGTDQGGAIYDYIGQLNLNFCTITGNSSFEAGGLYVFASPLPVLVDTIIASNNSPYYSEIMGNVASSSHNNFTSADGGVYNPAGGMVNGVNGNLVGLPAQLGPLAFNGGPTMTMALTTASPAARAGVGISGINTDQRGTARATSGAVDIGAYQLPGNFLPTSLTLSMPAKYAYGHPPQITATASYSGSSLPLHGSVGFAVDSPAYQQESLSNPGSGTSGQASFTLSSTLPPGSHNVSVEFTPDNYDEPALGWISSYSSGSITVTQAIPTITFTGTTVAYNGSQQSVQATVTGALGENLGAPPSLRYFSGTDTNLMLPLTSPPSAVGSYIVVAIYFGNADYLMTTVQGTFTILDPAQYGLVVNTLQDGGNLGSGVISLRQAVANAALLGGNQTITFDPNLFNGGPGTINITGYNSPISIGTASVTILGPGAKLLAVNGNGRSQVFAVVGATAVIAGMTITNGTSANGGAAIYEGGGASMTVSNLVLVGNVASDQYGTGGAILNFSPLNVINSTFIGNHSSLGGAIYAENSLTVTNCTFIGNQASGGGAVYENYGAVSLVNSTFFGNHATNGNGGALALASYQSQTPLLLNSTFSSNSASAGAGGGIALGQNLNHPVSIYNCIVSGNSAATNANLNVDVSATASTNNCLIDVDPAVIFVTGMPANNGGLTQTIALNPGGPAVDAGSNALLPAGLAVDQRGYPRINNRTVDIGAVEYTPPPPLFISGSRPAALSWPVGATGFHLQSTTNLNGGVWTDVPATVTQSNNLNQVIIPSPAGNMFYRLSL